MKTFIVNKTAEVIEKVKRTIYTVQVIALGLLIPFLFVIGISYNTQDEKPVNKTEISVPAQTAISNHTVELTKNLPDQNS